jgi:hypothetical protein
MRSGSTALTPPWQEFAIPSLMKGRGLGFRGGSDPEDPAIRRIDATLIHPREMLVTWAIGS